METTTDAVLRRLEKLERENRRLHHAGMAAGLVAMTAFFISGAAKPTLDRFQRI